jgi:hypothetical protein
MTPDHLHGSSHRSHEKGKHVMVHKPLANRLKEARLVIENGPPDGCATYFLPWDANGSMGPVMGWIRTCDRQAAGGAQCRTAPCGRNTRRFLTTASRASWIRLGPLVGTGGGPALPPHYTHMVFRGGTISAAVQCGHGHYSLWTVFNALELSGPTSIEPMLSHQCRMNGNTSMKIKNDYSFPIASTVRFKYPRAGSARVDLIWYDGG